MSDTSDQKPQDSIFPSKYVYILALIFVAMGIVNSMPTIPGWDQMWQTMTGIEQLKVRSFSTEYFYPLVFFIMMLIVAMKHSMRRLCRRRCLVRSRVAL